MTIDRIILSRAIAKWGAALQTDLLQEECIELALAIQKYKRPGGDSSQKFADLIDEIADVRIMIEQAYLLFDRDLINERVQYKLERLEKRLNNDIF